MSCCKMTLFVQRGGSKGLLIGKDPVQTLGNTQTSFHRRCCTGRFPLCAPVEMAVSIAACWRRRVWIICPEAAWGSASLGINDSAAFRQTRLGPEDECAASAPLPHKSRQFGWSEARFDKGSAQQGALCIHCSFGAIAQIITRIADGAAYEVAKPWQ